MALPVDPRVVAFAPLRGREADDVVAGCGDLAVEVQPELKTFTRVGE
jgi:hypothetical protein